MKRPFFFIAALLMLGTFSPAKEPSGDLWRPGQSVPDRAFSVAELRPFFAREMPWQPLRADLAPAKWIWLPSERTLPNTFLLFRRELKLDSLPVSATGWITADSRYRLTVNGRRIQWGPAPCDPRQMDVDPMDLASHFRKGENVIGVEVLHYGHGDGTWATGKPGFLFHLELEFSDGKRETVLSDESWKVLPDRAHRPGQHKRWYLRALQEEFDARLHPFGWDTADYEPDANWVSAMPLQVRADQPSGCSNYEPNDFLEAIRSVPAALRIREIPMLKETFVPPVRMIKSGTVRWHRDPDDWFDFRIPDSFTADQETIAQEKPDGRWILPAAKNDREGFYLMFEWAEGMVGWPYFEIDAPEGTIVELMHQEGHDLQSRPWLDSQYYSWTRFICKEGVNRFEVFDYEALRWVQLHVRSHSRPVTVGSVGIRRRMFDWRERPVVRCKDPVLQRVFDAAVNTLNNCTQETVVDGMARERQQYSGDCGHQLHALRGAMGEPRLARRFLRTYSEGITPTGFFLDCWPACDRLYRVAQKQIDCRIGPLLDHGVAFVFDNWNHYMETGDLSALDESYPRLLRFVEYLESLRGEDGLQPVEGLAITDVWLDPGAYRRIQRNKKCAFNLYTAAMLLHAMAPLADARGDQEKAELFTKRGKEILERCVGQFWDPERRLFVANRPWVAEDGKIVLDDRSLGMAVYYGLCPGGDIEPSVDALANCPPEMGLSYPCNACWRYWGLAAGNRTDVIVHELRTKWGVMPSVLLNNTLSEQWKVRFDSKSQWSHCPVVPLYTLFMDVVGIRPTKPGFVECDIRPRLADMDDFEIAYRTPWGPIRFAARKRDVGHDITVSLPEGCRAKLYLPHEAVSLDGGKEYRFPSGASVTK